MSAFTLAGSPPHEMLSHLALYGLCAILEEAGQRAVIWWSRGMNPRPNLETGLERPGVAEAVVAHARQHAHPDNWVQLTHPDGKGMQRGLLSPRRGAPADQGAYRRAREAAIDGAASDLDRRLIHSLGEPAYWRKVRGKPRPDDGASRYDMVPRNQGNELMRGRYVKLAAEVGRRTPGAVLHGLAGTSVRDIDEGPDSRTASGFRQPGPTDAAVAWCALWGIAWIPVAPRTRTASATATNLAGRPEQFVHPLWTAPRTPARIRTVLASAQLASAARGSDHAASTWLAARGVRALAVFPLEVVGSDNAPERRALRARIIPLGGSRG